MCSECWMTPCHPNCPNAPEPEKVYNCSHCNEPIYVGEEYYEFNGEHFHEECFEDIAVDLLLAEGASHGEAELEEYYDED